MDYCSFSGFGRDIACGVATARLGASDRTRKTRPGPRACVHDRPIVHMIGLRVRARPGF